MTISLAVAAKPPSGKPKPPAKTTPAASQEEAQARKEIEAVYQKINELTHLGDFQSQIDLYLPSFILVTKQGQAINRAQMIAVGTKLFEDCTAYSASSKMQKFSLTGKEAKAAIKFYAKMTIRRPTDGRTATLYIEAASEDEWVKEGKDWRMKRSRTLEEKSKFVPNE